MNDFVTLIQQVGFPIAVALYLLIRYDNRLGELTKIMSGIATNMELIRDHIQKED